MKSLGSNTFGLIKQNRKGKYILEGKYPLVKFGIFAESSDVSESNGSSDHLESEDDVITITGHKDERVPPVAIVAEEHDNMINVKLQSDFNESQDVSGDGDNDGEDEGFDDDDLIFGGDIFGHNDIDMNYEFENDYC